MNEVFKIGNEAVVMDPSTEAIPFLQSADPNFRIQSIRPSRKFVPKFQTAKDSGLLEEKAHEALAMLKDCELCGWKCKINRFSEKGKCGLSDKVQYEAPFIHIAEEPVINPAIVCNFTGCSMGCVHCIRKAKVKNEILSDNIDVFWQRTNGLLSSYGDVCSLEFAGGDPNPYIPWILACLKHSPDDFHLPLVWNSNLYVSEKAINLLNGIVDVYLPDFAFGNDVCAKNLSYAENYLSFAQKGIELMIVQKAKVIVRILVLPGHVECCHKKSIDWLSQFKDYLWISILDQYIPVIEGYTHREMLVKPNREEISEVEEYAIGKGLRNVLDADDFWKNGENDA
jgi:putative pyruvate formate lyase activating enzyme